MTTRRRFLRTLGLTAGATTVLGPSAAADTAGGAEDSTLIVA